MSLHGNVQAWAECPSGQAWSTGPWGVTVAGQPHSRGLRAAQNVPKSQIPAWVCGERRCSVLHPSLTALHNLIARREQPMQTAAELIAPVWRQLWEALPSRSCPAPRSAALPPITRVKIWVLWSCCPGWEATSPLTSRVIFPRCSLIHSLGAPATVSQDLQELLQHQRGHGLHQHLCWSHGLHSPSVLSFFSPLSRS